MYRKENLIRAAAARSPLEAGARRQHDAAEAQCRGWQRLPGVLEGTCGFVRVVDSGAIEIDLYDHSHRAQSTFVADIATILTIQTHDLPDLGASLAQRFGNPIRSGCGLVEALTAFPEVEALLGWLKNYFGVAFSKRVDFNV